MTITFPRTLLLAGILVFSLLLLKSHTSLGMGSYVRVVNSAGAQAGAAFVTASIFTSLCGFFTASKDQKQFIALCAVGGLILLAACSSYYWQFTIINQMVDKLDASKPDLLPDLVQKARVDDSADKREKWARMAFQLYGVRLSYQSGNGSWTYFEPTQDDEAQFSHQMDFEKSLENLKAVSRGLLNGPVRIVYTSFITFLAGLVWLACKKLPLESGSILDT